MSDEDAIEVRLKIRISICFKGMVVEQFPMFAAAGRWLTFIEVFFEQRWQIELIFLLCNFTKTVPIEYTKYSYILFLLQFLVDNGAFDDIIPEYHEKIS